MNSLRNRSTLPTLTHALVLMLGVGSALALATPSPASGTELPQITVSYQDLDLSRPADVRLLYRRLQRASSEVCGLAPSTKELHRHRIWQQCYDAALERAVVQVDAPQLLALHRAGAGNAGRG